jgi:hypothetical protein
MDSGGTDHAAGRSAAHHRRAHRWPLHAKERSRSLREVASAYKGNWRDTVVVLCIGLFGVIWWYVPHSRTNWLPMFIVLILLALLTTGYALLGLIRSVGAMRPRATPRLAPAGRYGQRCERLAFPSASRHLKSRMSAIPTASPNS